MPMYDTSSIATDVAPYVIALIAVSWIAVEVSKYTKIQFSQAQMVKLDMLAKAEAGALIAASATNLAGVSIPVGSATIANAVDRVIAASASPKILADVGLTPEAVATMVAGHVGAMQASAAPVWFNKGAS